MYVYGLSSNQISIIMSKSTSRSSNKSSATRKLNSSTPGRPKPMTPKAGVTKQRRKFDYGGELCW